MFFIMVCEIIIVGLLFLLSAISAQDNVISTITEKSLLDILPCPLPPNKCPNEDVTFYLYTRDTQDNPQVLDVSKPNSIENANFLENQPVKVLIHGYTGNHDAWPNDLLRPAYFEAYNYNIISVDYAPLASLPCPVTNLVTSSLVANCTAQLIDTLVSSGKVPLESFHVIGFSLGGQVMGQMSNYLKSGKLERATGLDPGPPLFGKENKLNEHDTKFVDVYHTQLGVSGKLEPFGTVDVYINKGRIQPGCQNDILPIICAHVRSIVYYAESINPKGREFIASPCTLCVLGDTYGGEDDKVIVGEYINKSVKGTYYLETNVEPPYAQG